MTWYDILPWLLFVLAWAGLATWQFVRARCRIRRLEDEKDMLASENHHMICLMGAENIPRLCLGEEWEYGCEYKYGAGYCSIPWEAHRCVPEVSA